jgi:hypothetical protein
MPVTEKRAPPPATGEDDSRIEELAREIRDILARLQVLEARGVGASSEAVAFAAGAEPAPDLAAVFSGALTLIGRSLVALGGGYLVRGATSAGVLPPLAGVAIGLAYGLSWLWLADRAAASGRRLNAVFHVLTSLLIAYPLLWEATTAFRLLPVPAGQAFLVLVFAVGLTLAARRRLAVAAWANVILGTVTAAGLLVVTRHLVPGVLALLVMAALVEGLAFRGLWPPLRWPAALLLDGAALMAIDLVARPAGLPEGYAPTSLPTVLAATLALPALYLTALLGRTLGRGSPVGAFDVTQCAIGLAVGLTGAARLLERMGGSSRGPGAIALLLGVLAYAASFAYVERRRGQARNFYVFSAAGAVLTLFGTRSLLPSGELMLAWSLLALCAAALGRRFDRPRGRAAIAPKEERPNSLRAFRTTLRFHAVFYVCAAALEAGMVGASWRGLFGRPQDGWPLPSGAGWIAAAVALVVFLLVATGGARHAGGKGRLAGVLAATAAAWCVGGLLVPLMVRAGGLGASGAAVAAVRTFVLAGLAVAAAGAARLGACRELAWVVHALLVVGGWTLVTQNLRQCGPGTLFLSLAFYGCALIASPALLKQDEALPPRRPRTFGSCG